MRATINADWLELDGRPVPRFATPHQGGRIQPSLIVLHDTAGRLTHGSAVAWFMDRTSKVSAHFVVEVDGQIRQLVACDRQAWHCGESSWGGRSGVNRFSIGIEMASPGCLTSRGKCAVAWWGERFDIEANGLKSITTDEHGSGYWMPYPQAQIEAVKSIIAALAEAYPSIREVVGHWQISPGRKVDPNPLLPGGLLGPVRRPRKLDAPADAVAAAQRQLAGLGYHPGDLDGSMGPRTVAALAAFQAQNGLSPSGKLDAPTQALLDTGAGKPMPERGEVKETDMRGLAPIVDEQASARTEGKLIAATGVGTALLGFFSQLGQVMKQLVVDWGAEVLLIGLGGVIAAFGVRAWRRSNRSIGAYLEDIKRGLHLGPTRRGALLRAKPDEGAAP